MPLVTPWQHAENANGLPFDISNFYMCCLLCRDRTTGLPQRVWSLLKRNTEEKRSTFICAVYFWSAVLSTGKFCSFPFPLKCTYKLSLLLIFWINYNYSPVTLIQTIYNFKVSLYNLYDPFQANFLADRFVKIYVL